MGFKKLYRDAPIFQKTISFTVTGLFSLVFQWCLEYWKMRVGVDQEKFISTIDLFRLGKIQWSTKNILLWFCTQKARGNPTQTKKIEVVFGFSFYLKQGFIGFQPVPYLLTYLPQPVPYLLTYLPPDLWGSVVLTLYTQKLLHGCPEQGRGQEGQDEFWKIPLSHALLRLLPTIILSRDVFPN